MSDSIIRWWPKSSVTMSIASMDDRHAALAARLAEVKAELKAWQGDAQTYHKRTWDAEKRLAEAEALLRRVAKPSGFGTMDGGMFVNGEDVAAIRAFLAPDSASGAAHSCVIDRFGYGACGVCGRSVAQHSASVEGEK